MEGGGIFQEKSRNELVIRVQPDESVYLKMLVKKPGLGMQCVVSELDLSYAKRYKDIRIPDAYESLLLDVLRDDRSNFVRNDELIAAWEIFTPILHQLEREKIKPEPYAFGSRGPAGIDSFIEKCGYKRSEDYKWEKL